MLDWNHLMKLDYSYKLAIGIGLQVIMRSYLRMYQILNYRR